MTERTYVARQRGRALNELIFAARPTCVLTSG